MKSKFIIITIVFLTLVGAALAYNNSSENLMSSVAEGEDLFDSYLKFKRLNVTDDQRRSTLHKQYSERESLATAIENQQLLNKELMIVELNEFRKEMLISRYFETFLKEKVTETAIQNYYSANVKQYQQRKVKISHVLVRTNKNMSDVERKAKLTTAHAAATKLNANVDFATVSKSFSEDTIANKKGGELGWLKEGAISPGFSKKIFSMKIGEISDPIETPFGFHVVKILEGPLVVTRTLDAVKGDIRYQLRNKAKDAELKRLVALVQ